MFVQLMANFWQKNGKVIGNVIFRSYRQCDFFAINIISMLPNFSFFHY